MTLLEKTGSASRLAHPIIQLTITVRIHVEGLQHGDCSWMKELKASKTRVWRGERVWVSSALGDGVLLDSRVGGCPA